MRTASGDQDSTLALSLSEPCFVRKNSINAENKVGQLCICFARVDSNFVMRLETHAHLMTFLQIESVGLKGKFINHPLESDEL